MDYSKFSDDTLKKLSNNEQLDYSKLSDDELKELSSQQASTQVEAAPIAEKPLPGMLESAGRGALQGISFGLADEAQAALQSGAVSGDDYEKAVGAIRATNREASEANPISYNASEILSGLLIPVGGAAKAAGTAGKVGAKLGKSALTGAAMGGLTGFGQSENKGDDLYKDTAIGAGAGAILGPAVEIAGNSIGKAIPTIKSKAGFLKDIEDSYKYGTKGVDIGGYDTALKQQGDYRNYIEQEFLPFLRDLNKKKNDLYDVAKNSAGDKTIKIDDIDVLAKQYFEENNTPLDTQKKLTNLLNRFGKKDVVEVTDEAKKMALGQELLNKEGASFTRSSEQSARNKALELANKQNIKNARSIVKQQKEMGNDITLDEAVEALRENGNWIHPDEALSSLEAKGPFSVEEGQEAFTSEIGNKYLKSKLLPQLKFLEEKFTRPDVSVRQLEDIRNSVQGMRDLAVKNNEYEAVRAYDKLLGDIKQRYEGMIDPSALAKAQGFDRTNKEAFSRMGIESPSADMTTKGTVDTAEDLAKRTFKAQQSTGMSEKNELDKAFELLKRNAPEDASAMQSQMDDLGRKAYLSSRTVQGTPLSFDVKDIGRLATVTSKLYSGANLIGKAQSNLLNSTPGQLAQMSAKLAQGGYSKYAEMLGKIGTSPASSKQALTYALMQDPEFRKTFNMLGIGEDENK